MKALITGASSGIGREMARYLSELGYELILVAREKDKLEILQKQLKTKTKIIVMDLGVENNIKSLYVLCKNDNIDILINNAGFGLYGTFAETDISRELELIDVNIKAVHILTKQFLKDMKRRGHGYILNVASIAAFFPGPNMAAYYASKAYVLRLTEACYYELKREKSKVVVSCLCPGPVKTNFNNIANVEFKTKAKSADEVAKYAIDEMLNKRKLLIIPGFKLKCIRFFSRFISDKQIMKYVYKQQIKKRK